MKITREKAIKFIPGLKSFFEEKVSVKCANIILKNKKLSQAEVDNIEELKSKYMEHTQQFKVYEDLRHALCKEHCEMNPDGSAKNINGFYAIKEDDKSIFDEKLKTLNEENKEVLEERDRIEKEFIEFLNEEIDIPYTLIPYDLLPDKVSPSQLESIQDLISFEE